MTLNSKLVSFLSLQSSKSISLWVRTPCTYAQNNSYFFSNASIFQIIIHSLQFFFRQIDELREALSGNERSAIRIEERVQRERDGLMMKLQESESR